MRMCRTRSVLLAAACLVLVSPPTHAQAPAFLVKDVDTRVDPFGSNPASFIALDGATLFTAMTQATGRELWRTDGTEEGTVLVRDLNPGSASAFEFVSSGDARRVGDAVYFFADDGQTGRQLWKSDGTAEGTLQLVDVHGVDALGSFGVLPRLTAELGGTLFLVGEVPEHGLELWKTDGTPEGSGLLVDIVPGSESGVGSGVVRLGDAIYFAGFEQATGWELWRSDGTAEGTSRLTDIFPGPGSASPAGFWQLAVVGGTLYFLADDGLGFGRELWKTDGTPGGASRVKDIVPAPAFPSCPR